MRNILVVGGAGGVGLAVVDALVSRSDNVTATVVSAQESEKVRARHAEAVAVHQVDLSDPELALEALNGILSEGRWDAVVVCAAIAPVGPIEATSIATFRKTMEVNVLSAVAIFKAALPVLRPTQGRIVFLSSMSGRAALPFVGAYSASKYALEGLGDVMRREAAPQGVKISLVEPGGIRTNMVETQLASVRAALAAMSAQEDARYGYLYRGFLKAAGDSHASTASTAEQVAAMVLEALDAAVPEARYVAGDDAKQLIALADEVSDHEMDAVLAQMFDTTVT